MQRIFFKNKKDCSEFFDEVRKNSQVVSWRQLAKFLGTSKSVIDNYRSRKICIPKDRFELLLTKLNESRRDYMRGLIEIREGNWGQVIGGKIAYEKNRRHFDEGRKIASRNKEDKYKFDKDMPLSEELCEFIGAVIGDGFTNVYDNHMYQTQITGDNELDREYYYSRLKPICEKLFNISPKIFQKEGWIRLNIYSKRLFEMLTNRFGIPPGLKAYTVKIPEEIIQSGGGFISHTLRGMFDTDGGVGFDKREAYKIPYVRINYTSVSERLIDQIHKILLSYSLNHSVHLRKNMNNEKNIYTVQINGVSNVRKFMSKIGFSNERHLSKLKKFIS